VAGCIIDYDQPLLLRDRIHENGSDHRQRYI
jgi:hypothetical protein